MTTTDKAHKISSADNPSVGGFGVGLPIVAIVV
jgi:hypothetical protein